MRESELMLQLNARSKESAPPGDGEIEKSVPAAEVRGTATPEHVHRAPHDGFTLAQ